LTGWIVPVTDRTKPHVRICAACERRDPHMSGIEDRDAGVHAAPGTTGAGPRSTPASIPTTREPAMTEDFTPAERARLEPRFTNLDRRCFALRNLPETVKGALFARYSRSA